MADNNINVRIKQKIDTESNWSKNNPVLLKGEKGLIEGTGKYKIGDGTSKWSDLPLYEGMTASDRSKLNSIASGATKVTVDSTLSSTSINPVQNKVINSALEGKSNTNHTHTKSQITDFPPSLKNPNAITFTGAVTGTYDGSTAKTVDIPTKTKITIVRW